MRRIFGAPKKEKAEGPTLEQAGDKLTSRGDRCARSCATLHLLQQHGAARDACMQGAPRRAAAHGTKPLPPPHPLHGSLARGCAAGGAAAARAGVRLKRRCSASSHPGCLPPPSPFPWQQSPPAAKPPRLDEQIRKCDEQLMKFREQLKKTRPGPAQESLKRRAMTVLRQKKMFEGQRETLYNQQFNMEQTRFTVESIQDTVQTVQVGPARRRAATAALGEQRCTRSHCTALPSKAHRSGLLRAPRALLHSAPQQLTHAPLPLNRRRSRARRSRCAAP